MTLREQRLVNGKAAPESRDFVGRLALVAAISLPVIVVLLQLAAARARAERGIVDINGIEVAVFVVPFLALCLSAAALTLAGLARLSPAPIVAYTVAGLLPNGATFSRGMAGLITSAPLPDRALGALLALLPAVLLYRARVVQQSHGRTEPRRDEQPARASGVLITIAVFSTIVTWSVAHGESLFASTDRAAAVLALGACLSLASARWRLVLVPVALLFAGVVHTLVVPRLPPLDAAWPAAWLYLGALGLVASAWVPTARIFERLGERPLTLFVLTNLLNSVDAIGTAIAVGSGRAEELNPVVRALGLPVKVVSVGAMTWLVTRYRPKWMWIPFAALCGVVIWHLGGIVINYGH